MDNPPNFNPDHLNNYPQSAGPEVYPPVANLLGDAPDYGYIQQHQDASLDPDNPPWGVLAGIGVWFASGAFLVITQIIGVLIWMIATGKMREVIRNSEEVMKDPQLLLISISTTIPAHLLTIALCWAVATGFGKRSLKESLGWEWKGVTPQAKFIIIISIVIAAFLAEYVLTNIIPTSEKTPFNEMLKTNTIRYLVAGMAVFTAPLTEELVYRGMLYSPLKRALGAAGAVSVTALLFAIVHVPQYWGAWGGIAGLLFLSIMLTIVRAKTRSILPCVLIHTLFNLIGAVLIVASGGKTE